MEILLQESTRRPHILSLYRSILKHSKSFKDPLITQFIQSTSRYQFKKESSLSDYDKIKLFLDNQQSFLSTIKASQHNKESLKYLINLTYGQIVFTPRHDHFIQARYLQKLPFGKKKFFIIPEEGYQISSPAPIPEEFKSHINSHLSSNPDQLPLYESLLSHLP